MDYIMFVWVIYKKKKFKLGIIFEILFFIVNV